MFPKRPSSADEEERTAFIEPGPLDHNEKQTSRRGVSLSYILLSVFNAFIHLNWSTQHKPQNTSRAEHQEALV